MKDAHRLMLQLIGARILSFEVKKITPSRRREELSVVFLNWLLVTDESESRGSQGSSRREVLAYTQEFRWEGIRLIAHG